MTLGEKIMNNFITDNIKLNLSMKACQIAAHRLISSPSTSSLSSHELTILMTSCARKFYRKKPKGKRKHL